MPRRAGMSAERACRDVQPERDRRNDAGQGWEAGALPRIAGRRHPGAPPPRAQPCRRRWRGGAARPHEASTPGGTPLCQWRRGSTVCQRTRCPWPHWGQSVRSLPVNGASRAGQSEEMDQPLEWTRAPRALGGAAPALPCDDGG